MTQKIKLVCPACNAINQFARDKPATEAKCGKCKERLLAGVPLEANNTSIKRYIQHSDLPLLVDFWAPWCGPCRMITPIIEELSAENADSVKIGKLNIDENPQTAQAYGVSSIPTLIVFKGGTPMKTFVGLQPKARLQEAIDEANE